MISDQIFNMIDVGLLVLDNKFRVRYWNRWMASHSGISANDIKGMSIFDYYPTLNKKKFFRNFKAVFAFGNCYFFPQKLYDYIFPFKPESSFRTEIDYMQQSCIMGPLRNDKNVIEYVYISVKDVTEAHVYESKLTSALFSLLENNMKKEEMPTSVQSVLSELLSQSGDEFLAKHSPSPKGKKDIASAIEEQIDDILSAVYHK